MTTWKWRVEQATLAPPQPDFEPPQLADVLNRLEREGWGIWACIPDPHRHRMLVVARAEPPDGELC